VEFNFNMINKRESCNAEESSAISFLLKSAIR
jgi:hypothetical protein